MASRTSVTSENITVAPGRHQQVGAEAQRRIGGQAAEGIAAAALHAHDQLGGGHGFAPAFVQDFQPRFHPLQDGGDVGAEAFMVLHPHGGAAAFGQPLRRQLFAAQAHHQHFAAEIGIVRQVLQGADRHHRLRAR